MKIEVTKKISRLIDEENNLKVINKLRNLIHYLMEGVHEEDYDNYITASELLSILEKMIWDRIETVDEEDEENLKGSLKANLSDFKTIISKHQISYKDNEEVLETLDEFNEIYKKLFIITKNN